MSGREEKEPGDHGTELVQDLVEPDFGRVPHALLEPQNEGEAVCLETALQERVDDRHRLVVHLLVCGMLGRRRRAQIPVAHVEPPALLLQLLLDEVVGQTEAVDRPGVVCDRLDVFEGGHGRESVLQDFEEDVEIQLGERHGGGRCSSSSRTDPLYEARGP